MSNPMFSLLFSKCYASVLKITTFAGFITSFPCVAGKPNLEYTDMEQLQRTIKNTSIGVAIGLTSPISIPVILMTENRVLKGQVPDFKSK